MKVSEANELVCPFMSNYMAAATYVGEYHTNCITTKCMAWKVTKTKKRIIDKDNTQVLELICDYFAEDEIEMSMDRVHLHDRFTDLYTMACEELEIPYEKDLETQDCEGYCQRLKG